MLKRGEELEVHGTVAAAQTADRVPLIRESLEGLHGADVHVADKRMTQHNHVKAHAPSQPEQG